MFKIHDFGGRTMYLRAVVSSVITLSTACSAVAQGASASSGSSETAGGQEIQICVLVHDELKYVAGQRDLSTGDTLVQGKPFRAAYPATNPPYALSARWLYNEPVVVAGGSYTAYGPPQVIPPDDLVRIGVFQGVPLFTEGEIEDGRPGMLLVPLRPGCEFQPYMGFDDFLPMDTVPA
jgi:hypothetical protein